MPRIPKASPSNPVLRIEMIDPRAWHSDAHSRRCAITLDPHDRTMLDLTGLRPEIVRVTVQERGSEVPKWWPCY